MVVGGEFLAKLRVMLEMQHAINTRVNPDWVALRFPYLRAVVVEGAEALEHYGWKWWKKQTTDIEQFRMELVDIWHFALSDSLLAADGQIDAALARVSDALRLSDGGLPAAGDVQTRLERLIGQAANRQFAWGVFLVLLADAGMDFDELFRQYVAKNTLNLFRQDHGYQEGTYRKVWAGKEDNEHLVEFMDQVDFSKASAKEQLYGKLSARYAQILRTPW